MNKKYNSSITQVYKIFLKEKKYFYSLRDNIKYYFIPVLLLFSGWNYEVDFIKESVFFERNIKGYFWFLQFHRFGEERYEILVFNSKFYHFYTEKYNYSF